MSPTLVKANITFNISLLDVEFWEVKICSKTSLQVPSTIRGLGVMYKFKYDKSIFSGPRYTVDFVSLSQDVLNLRTCPSPMATGEIIAKSSRRLSLNQIMQHERRNPRSRLALRLPSSNQKRNLVYSVHTLLSALNSVHPTSQIVDGGRLWRNY